MPAMVKSTEGSCGMRLADGTTVWPRSAKKRVKAALSPLASIAPAYRGQKRGRGGLDSASSDMPTIGLFSAMPVEPKKRASP